MKVGQVLDVFSALEVCAKVKLDDPKVNYGIAKNLKIAKSHVIDFNEENMLRIEAYSLKDEIGNPKVVNGIYDFGQNKKEADKAYRDLIDKEVDIEFYKINRSDATDLLPPSALMILLDVIIIDE